MSIIHNEHKTYYQTVEDWEKDLDYDMDDWASKEERDKALQTQDVWIMRWYPRTPIGFEMVCASTFEACLEAAVKGDRDVL